MLRSAPRILVLCGLMLGALSLHAQSPAAEEYRLKAAFVLRFPRFVEWPIAALSDRSALELCVASPDRFEEALRALAAGESLDGRAVVIRDIGVDRLVDSCHLIFIGSTSRAQARALLRRAATKPILTIGDTPGFLDDGGVINLHVVDRRIRFEINSAAAQSAGLRLSSQLLRLAVEVRSGPL